MATVASGINSGSGFSNSDTITSTTLNNHVNDATVTNILTADIASSSSKTTGVTFEKMQHISTEKVLARTSAGEGDVEEIDIAGASGILLDEDTMSSDSATRGATQQSIKAYVDNSSTDGFTPTSYTGGESVTLPNGLIMKFGTVTGVTSQTTIDITFGTAFPNEIICVQLTGQNTSGNTGANGDFFYQVKDQSLTTKITILHQQPSSTTSVANNVNWLVIGR
jgi:hypothetical protein